MTMFDLPVRLFWGQKLLTGRQNRLAGRCNLSLPECRGRVVPLERPLSTAPRQCLLQLRRQRILYNRNTICISKDLKNDLIIRDII